MPIHVGVRLDMEVLCCLWTASTLCLAHDCWVYPVCLYVSAHPICSVMDAHSMMPAGSASAILYNFTHSQPGATSVFTGQYQKWIVLYFSCTMYINILCSGKPPLASYARKESP